MMETKADPAPSTAVNPLPPPPPRVALARARWRSLGTTIQSITPSDLAHFILVVLAFAAIGWLFWHTWLALLPFQIGLVIAYIVLPIVDSLDRFMPRGVAVAIVLLSGSLILLVFLAGLIPALAKEIISTLDRLPSQAELRIIFAQLAGRAQMLPEPVQTFIRGWAQESVANFQTHFSVFLRGVLASVAAGAFNLINTISFLLGFLVLPTWLMATLGDAKSGSRVLRIYLPRWLRGDFWAVVRIFDRAFGVILRGQLLRAAAITTLTWLGLVALERLGLGRFDYKLVLAMWMGVFTLIPNIGVLIGGVPLVLAGLTQSPGLALIMLGLVIVVQQLESRFVSSRIESRVVDIHPAILVPALVAVSQFGLLWVFLASPLLVVIRDLYRYLYGRLSDPPMPAGMLPGGRSVIEMDGEKRHGVQLARPVGKPAMPVTTPARPINRRSAP